MSEPTPGERTLAAQLKLQPAMLAAARDTLNTIASLPWPRPERVSLLARLARAARADVGTVFGGLALDAAPLAGFDALVPIPGLGLKRVAALARALSGVDLTPMTAPSRELAEAKATAAALRAKNDELQSEIDRLLRPGAPAGSGAPPPPGSGVMRIAEVATSLGNQVALADHVLRSSPKGLRLAAVDMRLSGTGTAVGGDVALDLGSSVGGSAVGISFVPGETDAGRSGEAQVPDVRGYTTALAQRKLLARGFGAAIVSVAGARGVVTDQSPAPGANAPTGSAVRLIVRDADVVNV